MKAVLCYAGDFNLEESHVERLRRQLPEVTFVCKPRPELAPDDLQDAAVFIGWPTDEELAAMPSLRWVQLPSAGADSIVNRQLLRDDVIVTNSSGVFGVPGAEHALALMLAFTRQLHVHFRQQSERIWKRNPYCLEIQDSTVTVIGLGDIGTEVARKAKGLGAYVIGVKRSATDCPAFVDELCLTADLDSALAKSDFIVSALPLTEETKGLISAERIGKMKKGAVFVNVGRGPTVDETALIDALQNGRLEGAGLDVTEIEPLPETSPLWTMPNVLITSHAVGVTPKKAQRRTELYLENFARFLRGEPLVNTVIRTRGY
ncbi:D-2-hydroxyacid dehydrogenase [Paenibacillus piri]|uniref:D-2-hydroxyacid dehydrogenase n=1 Tax=Paenibacillus piri TaxID=2547395 RepID=A0A4R5KSA4_9BACL|nr:D-2-hydroxyacid dehydrogenase [Paenibacillus piri]TDF98733.1 D-2-hydroxyacid dehydrogenase [Paenibacillus piri]